MKFDELDSKMRVFETAHDFSVLPHMYMVARLDGRGFTKLTKETLPLEAPFDERFRGYWALRKKGKSAQQATKQILGLSVADKNELLFQEGINFNNVPQWQKRGIGIYWQTIDKEGFNPKTQEKTVVKRQQLFVNKELAMKDAYSEFVEAFLTK